MKISVLCCLTAFISFVLGTEDTVCNLKLLTSYGLKGLALPRDSSIICPQVQNNCCDKVDELYIHKYYQKNVAGVLLPRYARNNEVLPQVSTMLQDLNKVNFTAFARMFNTTPFCAEIGGNITQAYGRMQGANITNILLFFPNMTENLTHIYKRVGKLREGFYCTLCDMNTQSSVDLDNKAITYSKTFCEKLTEMTFPTLYFKWTGIYGFLIHFDLILNQTQNASLFTPSEKALVVKTLAALRRCQGLDQKKDCSDYCGLMYLNENSPLFDGDSGMLTNILTQYNTLVVPYKSTPVIKTFDKVVKQKTREALRARLRARGLDADVDDSAIDGMADLMTEEKPNNGTNSTPEQAPAAQPAQNQPPNFFQNPIGAIAHGANQAAQAVGGAVNNIVKGAGNLFRGLPRLFVRRNLIQKWEDHPFFPMFQPNGQLRPDWYDRLDDMPTLEQLMARYPEEADKDKAQVPVVQPAEGQLAGGRQLSEREIPSRPADLVLAGKGVHVKSRFEKDKTPSIVLTKEVEDKSGQRKLVIEHVKSDLTLESSAVDPNTGEIIHQNPVGYFEVDEHDNILAGPFDSDIEKEAAPGIRPRKLFFKRLRMPKMPSLGGMLNRGRDALGNIGRGISNFFGGGGGSGGFVPQPVILTDKETKPIYEKPRRRGRTYNSLRVDRKTSLDLFGESIDVIGKFQQSLNITNFIPDPNTLEQCKIYPVQANPYSLVNFTHTVSQGANGINLFDNAQDTFFTIEPNDLIAQLFTSDMPLATNTGSLDETIKSLIEVSNKDAISAWLTDYTRGFKIFNRGVVIEHIEESYPRYLAGVSRIFGAVATALFILLN